MFKRILLAVLLAGSLLPLAGCRLFNRDCGERDDSRYPDCERR